MSIEQKEIVEKVNSVNAQVDIDDFTWLTELKEGSEKTQSLEEKENEGILGMRKWWSRIVLGLIVLIVIFDMVLVVFYGLHLLNFDDSNVVIAVITDNFLKIFGLGFLITKEVFTKIYKKNEIKS